ncbi:MAG: hypothetical protein JKY94_10685 [Rhodobacteraceae bacterium]|nr:hypothetical protein [Paracoccaceae bacterium]
MTQTDQSDRDFHTARLLKKKLGSLLSWTPPNITKSVGPFQPEIFQDIYRRRKEVIESCQEKLAAYSDDQFFELVSSDPLSPNQIELNWERFEETEIGKMTQSEPVWYAAGFGHPNYTADFDYWSQSPCYTNHEALLLSLGVEPQHFTERQLDMMEEKAQKGTELWPSLHYMLRRREQFKRQFSKPFDPSRIYPQKLFTWFALVDLDVPKEFTSHYVTHLGDQPHGQVEQLAKRPHKRELDTIAQLFTVMAIEYFGYRPQDARSPTSKEIVDAAAKAGIEISDDTVRKYLRLGASFIPSDWKPDGS